VKAGVHVVIILALAATGWCQQEQSSGAKALYGAVNFKSEPTSTSPAKPKQVATSHPAPVKDLSDNIGIKYWLELIQPGSAEITRVNSTRIFHSGEKIRLHLETNVNGRVTLLQLGQDGAVGHVLFPDARINQGDNYIQAGIDTPVPSSSAWIKFDNHPGIERMVVLLAPADRYSPNQPPSSALPPQEFAAGSELEPAKTEAVMAMVEKGSKGLVLEVDNQSEKPASYAVLTSIEKPEKQSAKPQDALAIQIQFRHQ
jgi:Domain of unknown function (DUF4384)